MNFTANAKEKQKGKNGICKYSTTNKIFKFVKCFQNPNAKLTGMEPLRTTSEHANFWNLHTAKYYEIAPWSHNIVDTDVKFHMCDDLIQRGYFPLVIATNKLSCSGLLVQSKSN